VSDELKNIVHSILTPNFNDIPNSAISILQLPIIQNHLEKLVKDFEGE
jgi:hypothetical protein